MIFKVQRWKKEILQNYIFSLTLTPNNNCKCKLREEKSQNMSPDHNKHQTRERSSSSPCPLPLLGILLLSLFFLPEWGTAICSLGQDQLCCITRGHFPTNAFAPCFGKIEVLPNFAPTNSRGLGWCFPMCNQLWEPLCANFSSFVHNLFCLSSPYLKMCLHCPNSNRKCIHCLCSSTNYPSTYILNIVYNKLYNPVYLSLPSIFNPLKSHFGLWNPTKAMLYLFLLLAITNIRLLFSQSSCPQLWCCLLPWRPFNLWNSLKPSIFSKQEAFLNTAFHNLPTTASLSFLLFSHLLPM
jgi:hypothetical protein